MVTVDTNNPGPGAYDKVLPKIIHHTFNKGKKARFGSGMERYNPSLINRKDDWKQGPGKYKAEVSQELLDRKSVDMTYNTSNLKSKVARFPELKSDAPPLGHYEPSRYNEIGGGKISESI